MKWVKVYCQGCGRESEMSSAEGTRMWHSTCKGRGPRKPAPEYLSTPPTSPSKAL